MSISNNEETYTRPFPFFECRVLRAGGSLKSSLLRELVGGRLRELFVSFRWTRDGCDALSWLSSIRCFRVTFRDFFVVLEWSIVAAALDISVRRS